MPNPPKRPTPSATASVIVFGLDKAKKQRAGLFSKEQLELVTKAASAHGYSLLNIDDELRKRFVSKLKTGNVHTAGDDLIPIVGRQIYAQIETAADVNVASTKNGKNKGALGIEYRGIPRTFEEIDAGHLVLAQESLKDGWFEAIVIARDGDRFKVRWRDFSRYAAFERPVIAIGLPCPIPSDTEAAK